MRLIKLFSSRTTLLPRLVLLGVALGLAVPSAFATSYYWDSNDDSAGFGTANGTWAVPTPGLPTEGWSTSSAGTAVVWGALDVTTLIGDTVNFGYTTNGLGTGTITVSGNVTNGNMTFAAASGSIYLSGGTINFGNTTITVDNTSNNISSTLTGTNLTKSGTGTLTLSGTNTYTGSTTISGGVLVLNDANALPGGIGTSGGIGALTLSGATPGNGVLGLGAGDFMRNVGNGVAGDYYFGGNYGGWAAYGADRLVNIGGASGSINWSTHFNGKTLLLGAATADHKVTLVNPVALTGNRPLQINRGTAAVDAELSGAISGAAAGLTITGNGLVNFSGTNTYSGATIISGAELIGVTSGSCSNSPVTVTNSGNLGVQLAAANGQWFCGGLTNNDGSGVDINYNSTTPSTTKAPLYVIGNLAFTNANVSVRNLAGSPLAVGNYPLIKYTGSLSGTVTPASTTLPSLGTSEDCYLYNNTANNTIDLVVFTNNVGTLYWATNSGTWDRGISTNWASASGGAPSYVYGNGVAVVLDDKANGSSPILVTNVVTVSPASVTANLTNKSYAIYGNAIDGSATLTKNGNGTLTLSATNTYSGGTVVNAGALVIASTNGALGTDLVTLNGGSLSNSITAVLTNTINLASNATIANVTGSTLTLNGVITNTGGLTKSGAGTLQLTSTNTFSGGLTLNGGTVSSGSGSTANIDALGAAGGVVTVSANSSLTTSSSVNNGPAATLNKSFVLNANISFGGGIGATITGAVSGAGNITPGGAGGLGVRTLTLSNLTNSFTGAISSAQNSDVVVNSLADATVTPGLGNITLGSATGGANSTRFSWGSGAVTALTLNNRAFVMSTSGGGIINNNNATVANTVTIYKDLVVSATGDKTLQLGGVNTGTNTFAGNITNGTSAVISVAKANAGTWILSGTNTYSGGTTISLGTLVPNNNAAFGTGLLTMNGGTLSNNVANLVLNNSVNMAVSSAVGVASGINLTLGGVIYNQSLLTVTGPGTLTLTNANPCGPITVSGGTLLINGTNYAYTNLNATTWSGQPTGSTTNLLILISPLPFYYLGSTVYTNGVNSGTTVSSIANNTNVTLSAKIQLLAGEAIQFVSPSNNIVTVQSGATLGGTGMIGGVVNYQSGSLAAFTVSSYMTFTNAVFMTNVTVGVSMPTGLTNGVYVLATNYVGFTTNGYLNFATNSGSLGSGGSGVVSVSGKNLILTVSGVAAGGGGSAPKFSGISLSGTGLTLNVTNGTPNGVWTLLVSTNLLLPLAQWPTNRTGNYDGSGNLTTNIVNAATNPAAFYLLK